jgi:hypothetical protein
LSFFFPFLLMIILVLFMRENFTPLFLRSDEAAGCFPH